MFQNSFKADGLPLPSVPSFQETQEISDTHLLDRPASDPEPQQAIRRIYRVYYLIRALHIFAQSACLSILVSYAQGVLGKFHTEELMLFGRTFAPVQFVLFLVLSNYLFEALLELFTGQYADRFGRTRAVKAYSLCYLLSSVCFAAASHYPHILNKLLMALLAGQAFRAFGATFLNGSLESWAVDSLKFHGGLDDKAIKRLFANASWVVNAMWLLGGTVALALKRGSAYAPWILIVLLMVVIFCVASRYMREDYNQHRQIPDSSGWMFLRDAMRECSFRKNRNVFLLTLGFAGGYVLWLAIADLWAAAYQDMASPGPQEFSHGGKTLLGPPIEFVWIAFCIARFGGSLFATFSKKASCPGGVDWSARPC